MIITTLQISDFRNMTAIEWTPCPQLNLISGANGSGKTNLLEAIYHLGRGRSFRSATTKQLIRYTATQYSLFASLTNHHQQAIPVGIERTRQGAMRLRIAEQHESTLTELVATLPLHCFHAQSHQLLEAGPLYRRQYIDWGLFYQTERFLSCWRPFMQTLKQRNMLLRAQRSPQELAGWTVQLIHYGLQLDQLRRAYVATWIPVFHHMAQALLGVLPLEVVYQPGWDQETDWATVLAQTVASDYRVGYTQWGPHRGDLTITLNGMPIKHLLSRGQQKLLICAMILAQGALLTRTMKTQPIYLIDDLPAELDPHSQHVLLSLLLEQKTQLFITAIDGAPIKEQIQDRAPTAMKVFHVKQGQLVEQIAETPVTRVVLES